MKPRRKGGMKRKGTERKNTKEGERNLKPREGKRGKKRVEMKPIKAVAVADIEPLPYNNNGTFDTMVLLILTLDPHNVQRETDLVSFLR